MKIMILLKILLTFGAMIFYQNQKPCKCQSGMITDKIHIPEQQEEREYYSIALDAPMTRTIKHEEKYVLVIIEYEKELTCEVTNEVFMSYSIGEIFNIRE